MGRSYACRRRARLFIWTAVSFAAVETPGKGTFDRASDIAAGLGFSGTSEPAGAGLGVAFHSGDGDGVQGGTKRPITAAVEAIPRS